MFSHIAVFKLQNIGSTDSWIYESIGFLKILGTLVNLN